MTTTQTPSNPNVDSRNITRLHKPRRNIISATPPNTQHFRAGSFALHLPALRPCLLGALTLALTILAIPLLSPPSASASNLTLTIPSAPLSLTLAPSAAAPAFEEASAKISVATDSLAGYTLNLKSANASGALALADASASIPSIVSPTTPENFQSSPDLLNSWGYKPSKLSSSLNENYQPAPTALVVLDKTSTQTSAPVSYDISIAAKVDASQLAGQYQNSFVFTAEANAMVYSITYDQNATDESISGMPGNADRQETHSTTVPITAEPTRSGYTFRGWCDQATTKTGANDACPGTLYDYAHPWTLASADNTLNLHAMWGEILLTDMITADADTMTFQAGEGIEMVMVSDINHNTNNKAWTPYFATSNTPVVLPTKVGTKHLVTVVPKENYKLASWTKVDGTWTANGVLAQDNMYKPIHELTTADCAAAGEKGLNVTDTRNGVSYTVGMFGDECFMFSDLRLEPGTSLTSDLSDVSGPYTLPADYVPGAWSWDDFSGKAIACHGTTGYTSFNDENYKDGDCKQQADVVTTYYYNWHAVTANPSSHTITPQEEAKSLGSICPAGWQLPTENEATTLASVWNNSLEQSDNAYHQNFINPGRLATIGSYFGDLQYNVGMGGYFYTSSAEVGNTSVAAAMVIYGYGVRYPVPEQPAGLFAVRCILNK